METRNTTKTKLRDFAEVVPKAHGKARALKTSRLHKVSVPLRDQYSTNSLRQRSARIRRSGNTLENPGGINTWLRIEIRPKIAKPGFPLDFAERNVRRSIARKIETFRRKFRLMKYMVLLEVLKNVNICCLEMFAV